MQDGEFVGMFFTQAIHALKSITEGSFSSNSPTGTGGSKVNKTPSLLNNDNAESRRDNCFSGDVSTIIQSHEGGSGGSSSGFPAAIHAFTSEHDQWISNHNSCPTLCLISVEKSFYDNANLNLPQRLCKILAEGLGSQTSP